MRAKLLLTVPIFAAAVACGDGSDLPAGHWSRPGEPATGSSSGPSGSSSGATASSGGSGGGGSSGSGSGGGSGGAMGPGSSSSGSSSGGSSGSSSGSPPPPPNLGVSLDQTTVQSQLMVQTTVHVSVAPNGYSGPVLLQTAAMPTGVTAAFNPAMVVLDGTSSGTAELTLTTDSAAPPATASIEVDAIAAGTTAHATMSLEVQSIITIHIPMGVNNNGGTTGSPVTSAYGPYPIKVTAPANISDQAPVTVYFMNDDATSHEIHADSPGQGFGHDPGPFGAMSMDPYVRKVNAVGSYDFYLHDQGGPSTLGLLEIQ